MTNGGWFIPVETRERVTHVPGAMEWTMRDAITTQKTCMQFKMYNLFIPRVFHFQISTEHG